MNTLGLSKLQNGSPVLNRSSKCLSEWRSSTHWTADTTNCIPFERTVSSACRILLGV